MTQTDRTCANHPERAAAAFCQDCGKPLCPACTRSLDGLLLCEPCLLLRYPAAAQPQTGPLPQGEPAPSAAPGDYRTVSGYRPVAGYTQAAPAGSGSRGDSGAPAGSAGANPALAGLLGLIPGVGAMYNGQFIKAFLHVAIFVALVAWTEDHDYGGFLIAAWIFYQVFDAAQTAAARRDGGPLPDPLGLLEISRRLGPDSTTYPPPQPRPGPTPPTYRRTVSAEPFSGVSVDLDYQYTRTEPIGAIVLIAIGLLFLLSTLGVLHGHLLARFWPLLLLGLGVWLLVRRVRTTPPNGPVAIPPAPEAARRSPFSITPEPEPAPAPEIKEDRR